MKQAKLGVWTQSKAGETCSGCYLLFKDNEDHFTTVGSKHYCATCYDEGRHQEQPSAPVVGAGVASQFVQNLQAAALLGRFIGNVLGGLAEASERKKPARKKPGPKKRPKAFKNRER